MFTAIGVCQDTFIAKKVLAIDDSQTVRTIIKKHLLMRIVNGRRLAIRFVADSAESHDMLKQFRETADIPIDVSLECALNAIAC